MRTGRISTLGLAVLAMAVADRAAAQDQSEEPLTERHDTFESAVATPAEDLNLKRTPIPEVLQRAAANPYDMRTLEACDAVAAEVQRLDAALGADRDEPPTPDTRTLDEKRDGAAASALKFGIEAVTPYRGIVRWVTGADAHAKTVQDAIEAGFARRGFLKGLAVKMNCPPPASPAWFRPVSSPPAQYQAYAPPPQSPARSAARRYGPYDDRAYGDAAPYGDQRTYGAYRSEQEDRDYRAYRNDRYYDPYDR